MLGEQLTGGGGVIPSGGCGTSGIHRLARESLIGIERCELALPVIDAQGRVGLAAPLGLD